MFAPSHSRLRRLIETLAVTLIVLLVLRTWLVEGLFRPLVVTGGSMAPAMVGMHREVTCGDCQYRFACGSEHSPVGPRAVCPNCGYADSDLACLPDLPGDRVLVHKLAFRLWPVERWELAVFCHPEDARRKCVKRVVGLPGESIQIRNGDVYVDGRIQRKPLEKQRAVAVLVHDADHRPGLDPSPPARWQGHGSNTDWGSDAGRFAHPGMPEDRRSAGIDWLTYGHWRRVPGQPGRPMPVPISDDCAYEQSRPRRVEDSHEVTDLLLSLRLSKLFGQGKLWIRAHDGREQFQVCLEPSTRTCTLERSGRTIPQVEGRLPRSCAGCLVEFSLFDQQILLALDGCPVLVHPHQPADRPLQPTPRPVAIGSQGLGVQIGRVRLYRDVYYTQPFGPDGRWATVAPVQLGPDEYFVLGDNSPISSDSRSWPGGPALPARLLLGKPLLVYSPSRRVTIGGWHFHVPDPARIRYIH